MMKKLFFVTLALLFSSLSYGQDKEKYATLIAEAEKLYEEKDFLTSGKKYAAAFALEDKGMVTDRYNAACSWALADEVDSSFVQLFRIAQKGNFTSYDHLIRDPDLQVLYTDPRWEEVKGLVKKNKEKEEENYDKPLVAMLDTIYQEDQQYRQQMDAVEKEYGWESEEMKALWKVIHTKDSINLLKVSKLLDERGWLGSDVIGRQGNSTLFLVIQHSDLATQEKYLPMMREAAAKGNANPGSLALLEDRVALRQGKNQIYGSQIGRDPETGEHYVLPLEDPDNVDKRRAEVGLPPLSQYVSHWGMEWDVEAYKKALPAIEAKQKK